MASEPLLSPLQVAVLSFCRAQLARDSRRPLIVGLQGPQGAGKTTLCRALTAALATHGIRAAALSIDDFYVPRAAQLEIADAHAGNPYLEHRGYPGTHDIELGERTLRALRASAASCEPIALPVYDKSAHSGRGDRAPIERWTRLEPPVDVVLLEGWMLGFTAVAEATLADLHLHAPNRALAGYARWYRHIDAWILLRALDPGFVLRWRVEAEERSKATGAPGLSRAEIEDYVRRFLPAYRTWSGAPSGVAHDRTLELFIDVERRLAPGPPLP